MTLPAELRGHRLLRVRPAQRRRPSVVSSSQLALHNGEVTTNNVVGKDLRKKCTSSETPSDWSGTALAPLSYQRSRSFWTPWTRYLEDFFSGMGEKPDGVAVGFPTAPRCEISGCRFHEPPPPEPVLQLALSWHRAFDRCRYSVAKAALLHSQERQLESVTRRHLRDLGAISAASPVDKRRDAARTVAASLKCETGAISGDSGCCRVQFC